GIIAPYRRLEERVVVRRAEGGDDDEAGNMRIPRLERLRMLRRRRAPHPRGLAHDERHAALAAEHVARLGRLVDQLVDGAEGEIGEAHLDHRPRADERRADGGAEDRRFRDRRVDDARRAELLDEASILAEDAAPPEILA